MSNARILLVEDEFMIRLILAESLADGGYDVVEAGSGDEAVRALETEGRFGGVITDIHMPGKTDGVAVGQKVRRLEPLIPVIYVTGRPDAMNALGHLGPMEALVRKPYKPSQVVTVLRGLLLLTLPKAAGSGGGQEGQ